MSGWQDWWQQLIAEPMLLAALALLWLVSLGVLVVLLRRASGLLSRLLVALSAFVWLAATSLYLQPPVLPVSTADTVLISACPEAGSLDAVAPRASIYWLTDSLACPGLRDWLETRATRADSGATLQVSRLDDIALWQAPPERLTLLGHGLPADAWARARFAGRIDWQPPRLAEPLRAVDWPADSRPGEAIRIVLDWASAEASQGKTIRVAIDDGEALITVSGNGAARQTLTLPALPVGNYRLTLQISEADGALASARDLPLQVRAPTLARSLLIADSPSFEWRALQRWLSDSGAAFAARVRVSADRYQTRFERLPKQPLASIDSALLSAFDLVILDGAALQRLDTSERETLLAAAHGAGVLVLLHEADDVAALSEDWQALLSGDAGKQMIYRLADAEKQPDSGLSRMALRIDADRTTALLSDALGNAFAARIDDRIAISLLADSYRLPAIGAAAEYAALWSALTRALARPADAEALTITPLRAEQGRRLQLCRRGDAETPLTMTHDAGSLTLPLVADLWRPGERCGWWWPDGSGWWRVADADGRALASHYVARAGMWANHYQRAASDATRDYLSRARASDVTVADDRARQPMPRSALLPWWLLAALFAWLSQRVALNRPAGAPQRPSAAP